jgi:streptogramin lyase
MDHDSLDLIARLSTRAGMIMEDSSVLAIARLPADALALSQSLANLSEATEDIGALIRAARAVARAQLGSLNCASLSPFKAERFDPETCRWSGPLRSAAGSDIPDGQVLDRFPR